jgi:uncharacterized protein (DUF58 family)
MAEYLKKALSLRRKAEQESADLPSLMALAEKAASSILHGEHTQRKSGPGEKFWQFREYSPGDRPQDIDWRQSAKTDRVYVRQKEWQTTQNTAFWCASGPGMEFSSKKSIPTKSEIAKILTLALSLLMTRSGEQIGLLGAGRMGRSENILQHIGNALCDPARKSENLPDIKSHRLAANTSLIQIGDFLQPYEEIESVFKSLSGQTTNGIVIQILDPAEINLPYQGRVIFEDPANRARENISHVRSIKQAYKERIREHLRQIDQLCRHCGWRYMLHRTDKPLNDTLATLWAQIHHESHAAEIPA